ncbi:MAG: D-alanine--D-alanine ligase [Candidatus Cloacimonetes bacterium]|nr:D-alanine--D-alanine ligase [Candidatus Cloacimonadota bacterium]
MKLGLTYDLRDNYLKEGLTEEETAEMDSVSTIDALEETIRDLGYQIDKIGNIKSLVSKLALGERWDLVFNIAEGVYGMGREAQVPAVLDAYRIPYTFSDTIVLAVALQKALTKRIVSDLGIPTSDFFSVRTEDAISLVKLPFPLFAKPVAEGTGRGVNDRSIINNKEELEATCLDLLRTYKQPVLVERYLPGREFTVGIIGTGAKTQTVGVMEVVLKPTSDVEVYGYKAKELCEQLIDYIPATGETAEKAKKMALIVHKGINCRDSSRVDFKEDENGELQFLEINPLAGLHPTHSDLPIICSFFNISYKELIYRIIESAKERITPQNK